MTTAHLLYLALSVCMVLLFIIARLWAQLTAYREDLERLRDILTYHREQAAFNEIHPPPKAAAQWFTDWRKPK
jgi:ABC-type bacteriocin/lantibiotic exporter with double-glycine peptidase domain